MQASKAALKIVTTISAILACSFSDVAYALMHQVVQSRHIHRQTAIVNNDGAAFSTSRRDAFAYASLLLVPVVVAIAVPSDPANALEECGKKSHNCIRTTWRAPPSIVDPHDAAKVVRDVLNSYPQEGQAGVDCNGWRVVNDGEFDSSDSGTIALEYKSCVGPAALAINLGRPFVDDLKLEMGRDQSSSSPSGGILVEVKSSSRMGSSDLFVNRKRMVYLGKRLKERGWSVPEPRYVYEK
jgi:hypothetical protein